MHTRSDWDMFLTTHGIWQSPHTVGTGQSGLCPSSVSTGRNETSQQRIVRGGLFQMAHTKEKRCVRSSRCGFERWTIPNIIWLANIELCYPEDVLQPG